MQKSDSKVDIKLFLKTLEPSLTSSIISILIGAVFAVAIIFLTRYKNSPIQRGYTTYLSGHHLSLGFLDKSIFSTGILGNSLIFAFWLLAGVLVYVLAVDIVKGVKNTLAVEQELNYVHLDKAAALRYNIERTVIRVVSIIVWAIYLYEFIHKIIPSAIYLAIAASGSSSLTTMPLDVVLSIAIIAASLHINLILFRLLLLRPRVYNNQII